MSIKSPKAQSIISCVIAFLFTFLIALPNANSQINQAGQVKLVLVLVIDQFSYDYLARYKDKLNSGFRYLIEHGANFSNCRYKQATTQTAVGHSIIATGAYPWATGIIANEWYDRRKDKTLPAISDDSVQLIGANGKFGASAKSMNGTTIGDELKMASNGRSKVITVSLKDRASLFLAGNLANSAFWWDMHSGNFVSGSQYGNQLPGWATSFNERHYADQYFGQSWQKLLPETEYNASTRDNYTHERAFPGDGKEFPHVISGGAQGPNESFYAAFSATPWSNQMLIDFAKEAIDQESLGARGETDFLGISFSASDYLGHAFGPYSHEMEDLIARLDQTLGSFLNGVDQKIGLNNCVIVLTSDHGVSAIPEFLKERGLDAGRIDPKSLKTTLDSNLDSRLGQEDWISSFTPPNLYLNLNAIDKLKYRQPDVEAVAAKICRQIPGIASVFTAFQFFSNQVPLSPYAEAAKKNYYWGRSGELYIVPKSGYIFGSEPSGTSHGSTHMYDSQVPLIIAGPGVKSGIYSQSASPNDIAPTISAILNITQPSLCEGRVLNEALGQFSGPPTPLRVNKK